MKHAKLAQNSMHFYALNVLLHNVVHDGPVVQMRRVSLVRIELVRLLPYLSGSLLRKNIF